MEKKEFLNQEKMYDAILEIYKDALSDEEKEKYEDFAEEYAEITVRETLDNMRTYVHKNDTKLYGNFCNIREDWEITKDFVKSDVAPWGKFSDIVASIDDGSISDEDLAKFQIWCQDWFFTAFGTFNLRYNFETLISDLEYEEEREREDA